MPKFRCGVRVSTVMGLLTLMSQALGAVALHRFADVIQHGNRSHGAQPAGGAYGVADGVIDAVAFGNLEIVSHGVEPADGDSHPNVIGAVESGS